MEQLIIVAVIVGLSLLHGWWKKRQGETEGESESGPEQSPQRWSGRPPSPAASWEEELRRLLQGEPPPPVVAPAPPPLPPVALLHDVVIGQCQEMIAVGLVPVGDALGEIIPVAPERVRVQVALPPADRFARGGLGGVEQGADREENDP